MSEIAIRLGEERELREANERKQKSKEYMREYMREYQFNRRGSKYRRGSYKTREKTDNDTQVNQ